ncbi:helix-turn-helix transcriptional regulator [Nocardioides mesophilus]|uniref:WYL domain-containing protein n=1 Tax=Nocardioides mesophilus TaxID=433659 RepID=A0A7G9RAW9_9ACTN|nr:WYL domain-containing protein [Nocardioides mesophilus]QNN52744.1 WYL domain-containing protein [Nocardioides mesophilus]
MSGAREQVARLLALVPYIQARREVPVAEAAAEFGVSAGQIARDLNVLWFCGLPGLGMGDLIEVDMDALEGEGVIRVSNADYLTRPLRLDSSEASALIVALRALRETGGAEVRPVVDRTLGKLEAAAGDAAALAAHVDVHLPTQDSGLAAVRSRLGQALERGVQVRLDYYVPARDESTARTVDPLRLVSAEGHDYLEAWCHSAEGQRLFRLDRISSAELLDTPAQQHDVAPRDLSAGLFQPSPEDLLVTLLLEPQARWVAEYYPTERVEEAPGGRLRVDLRVGDPAWLSRLLLRLGSSVSVEQPAAIADDVRRTAVAALAHYT